MVLAMLSSDQPFYTPRDRKQSPVIGLFAAPLPLNNAPYPAARFASAHEGRPSSRAIGGGGGARALHLHAWGPPHAAQRVPRLPPNAKQAAEGVVL
eukprot:1195151-Prorocentrum_minimum.AAC.1